MTVQLPQIAAEEISYYNIKHCTIRAEQISRNKKPLFVLNGREMRVEDYSAALLEDCGAVVFLGADVHLALSFLAANFLTTFFAGVFCNWVRGSADRILENLKVARLQFLRTGKVTDSHLDIAYDAIANYFATYPPKLRVYSELWPKLARMDRSQLERMVMMYVDAGYTVKGAPDLVAFYDLSPWFIEVKSLNDSLSADQYRYFEQFAAYVGENFLVLRVLPRH